MVTTQDNQELTIFRANKVFKPITASECHAIYRAHLLHDQLSSAIQLAKESGIESLSGANFMSGTSPYMEKLAKFYREELALARLLDTSDLLLHAQGPATIDNLPRLGSVNWLYSTTEKQLKNLLGAMLPIRTPQTNKTVLKGIDLRLTGMAQGSLYAGFCLNGLNFSHHPSADLFHANEEGELLKMLRHTIHALPIVPQYIGSESVDSNIMEALPDPALRDAVMATAYEMTPTGTRGIHTISISAPLAHDSSARAKQTLGLRERVVLHDALNKTPMMRNSKQGSFVGVLRAIDLDASRITVRNISAELLSIRGVCLGNIASAKQWLDKTVKIEGRYECDATGRPRMMVVNTISLFNGNLI